MFNLYIFYSDKVIANYTTSYDGETVLTGDPTAITNYIENEAIDILLNQNIDGHSVDSTYTEDAMKSELKDQGNLLFYLSFFQG